MQDGATPHTARATRALLQTNRVNVLLWPSCSPYLNPIEHVWDVIGRKVRARDPVMSGTWRESSLKNGVDSLNVFAWTTLHQCAADAGP